MTSTAHALYRAPVRLRVLVGLDGKRRVDRSYRACVDCGTELRSKSPRCPEHRLAHRRVINRRHYASWFSRHPDHRREQRAKASRKAAILRLEATAARLGFTVVPIAESGAQ